MRNMCARRQIITPPPPPRADRTAGLSAHTFVFNALRVFCAPPLNTFFTKVAIKINAAIGVSSHYT